jgi:hypothetical protein
MMGILNWTKVFVDNLCVNLDMDNKNAVLAIYGERVVTAVDLVKGDMLIKLA